jgi:hypothetical protein
VTHNVLESSSVGPDNTFLTGTSIVESTRKTPTSLDELDPLARRMAAGPTRMIEVYALPNSTFVRIKGQQYG